MTLKLFSAQGIKSGMSKHQEEANLNISTLPALIPCPNRECIQLIPRKELRNHLEKDCAYRENSVASKLAIE